MKRITPNSVVDAYIATGMYPVFRKWSTRDNKGGCGLIVTLCSLNGSYPKHKSRFDTIVKVLGLELDYARGFTRGFDGRPPLNYSEYFDIGQHDGRAAREAVREYFGIGRRKKALSRSSTPELATV